MNEAGYPVFLNVARRPVLVVGGGAVALRKVKGLLECGAAVTMVSVEFAAGLGGVEKIQAAYESSHMAAKRWRLVFAATDSVETNAAVQRDAAAAGILCCRCDDQAEGDFANGAVGRVGGIVLAVGTQGASPALSGRIRDVIVRGMDPVLAELAMLSGEWRERVKGELAEGEARHELLRKLAGEEMEACLRMKGRMGAEELLGRWLRESRGGGGAAVEHG